MNNLIIVLLYVAIVAAIVILGPIALLWSLNTLFPSLAIPYTLETWVAALIVGAVVGPKIRK